MAGSARAQTSDEARKQLTGTMDEIAASSKREKVLEEKNARLERELQELQRTMVTLTKEKTTAEDALSSYEDKLAILEDQKAQKLAELHAHEARLSSLISAMIELHEIPPEAVIAMPGKLEETLATARTLTLISHTVKEESESLQNQLVTLNDLESTIAKNREAVDHQKQLLETKQQSLAEKLQARSKIQAELGGKEREEKAHTAKLMARSQNLQQLLSTLEDSERKTAEHEKEASSAMPAHAVSKHERKNTAKLRSFANAEGKMPLPARGHVISHFGNTSNSEAFAKGILIETRAGSSVVAPYDGEVVFAGTFRDYGKMIILRHSDGYHTLLAGLEHIDCTPGQFLLEGEPLGTMGKQPSIHLYVELREDGKPVDPLPWFKG